MGAARHKTIARPFPGLRPFEKDESPIFFGRGIQIDDMLRRLEDHRFMAVVGSSGCGKSSLVQAGLLPALEEGELFSAGNNWLIVTAHPGASPFANLAVAWSETQNKSPDDSRTAGSRNLSLVEAVLRSGSLGLLELIEDTQVPADKNILLLIDQFEEIFRFRYDDDRKKGLSESERDESNAFVNLFLESAAQTQRMIYVVLTMRSDFLGDCNAFHGLPEAINDSQFLTPRLNQDQIRQSILGPLRVFGAEAEPALINRIIGDVGNDPDQLPLMQHVLMRMWNEQKSHPDIFDSNAASNSFVRLALPAYERLGGVQDALSNHVSEVFEQLQEPGDQQIATTLFRSLRQRGEKGQEIRRPVTIRNIATTIEDDPDQSLIKAVTRVVDAFRHPDCSFLTPPHGTGLNADTLIDISHESLIRRWKMMRGFSQSESESADTLEFLIRCARACAAKKGDLLERRNLERVLEWKDQERPTAGWASRYTTPAEFRRAMEFLDESRVADKARRDQEKLSQQQEQNRAKRELENARKLAESELKRSMFFRRGMIGFGVLTLIALGLALFAIFQYRAASNALDNVNRLSDIQQLRLLEDGAEHLWPAIPEKDAEFKEWIANAEKLANKLDAHERNLIDLRARARGGPKESDGQDVKGRWSFDNPVEQWQHDTLTELTTGLKRFVGPDGLIAQVRKRHQFAQMVYDETITKQLAKWQEAIADISDRKASPHYGGLLIKPQVGLIPLGRSPHSGLWEFAQLQTGAVPTRADSGQEFKISGDSAIVLVLVPAGEFSMGSKGTHGKKYSDDFADAQPVQKVKLAPFFISKYEMTQGQWERTNQNNPSIFKPGASKDLQITLNHPVESVTWFECMTILTRQGLSLPTEAQWEYAARAGTVSPWASGDDESSLANFANISDQSYERYFGKPKWGGEDWLDDGFAIHAPVGSFAPNSFGLFDTAGNVYEWCLDSYDVDSYKLTPRKDDGFHEAPATSLLKTSRGGSYSNDAGKAICSMRFADAPGSRFEMQGVRPVMSLRN